MQERARARCRSGASLLRAALEQGAARGAEVATVMGHARPDPINVRDVLLAEPHRIRFAGRALLRGPLLRRCWRRRERECKTQERGRERGGGHRPELRLCDTNFHYRPSSWCSAPVSTVNPMGMASSHAGDGDPSKNRQGDRRRRRGSVDRVTVANCPLLPAISAPGVLRAPPLPASGERFGDCGRCAAGNSIPVADGQLLGREQRDHAATLVGHHDLLLDAGGGVAVARRAIGLEREYHALLDFGWMIERDHA